MQQHPVPQNIMGVEFQLIGNMTIRQFAYVGAGALIAWLSFTAPFPFLIKWTLVAVFGLGGLAFGFLPVNDIPLDRWVNIFINAIYAPTKRVWRKQARSLDFLYPSYSTYLQKQTTASVPAPNRAKLEQYLTTLQPTLRKNELDLAEESYLESLNFALLPPPSLTPSAQTIPTMTTPEVTSRSVVEETAVTPENNLASEVGFKPVVTIRLPDKSVYVKPVSNVRLRSLHRLSALGGTIVLPIRGERVLEIPEEIKKQFENRIQATDNPKPAMPGEAVSILAAAPVTPHVPPKPIFSTRKEEPKSEILVPPINGADSPKPTTTPTPTISEVLLKTPAETPLTLRSLAEKLGFSSAPTPIEDKPEPTSQPDLPLEEPGFPSEPNPISKPTSSPEITKPEPIQISADSIPAPIVRPEPKITAFEHPFPIESEFSEEAHPIVHLDRLKEAPSPVETKPEVKAEVPPPQAPTKVETMPIQLPPIQPYDVEKDILKQRVNEMTQKIEASDKERETLLAEINKVNQQITQAQASSASTKELEKLAEDYKAQLGRVRTERETLFAQISAMQSQIKSFQESLNKSQVEKEETEKALEESKTKLAQAEAEKKQAIERAAKMQALLEDLAKQKEEAAKEAKKETPVVSAEKLPNPENNLPIKPVLKVVGPKKAEGKMAPAMTSVPNVINGVVKDKNGLLVSDVIIVVKDVDDEPVRALKTNKIGQFAISTSLPNGTYTMELEKDGYEFDIIEIIVAGEILAPIEIRAK